MCVCMAGSAYAHTPSLTRLSVHENQPAGAEYCPFIVSLYDAYKHQNQLRLVMEYMNGGSLQVGAVRCLVVFVWVCMAPQRRPGPAGERAPKASFSHTPHPFNQSRHARTYT